MLPDEVPFNDSPSGTQTRKDLIDDIFQGVKEASMTVRITYAPSLPYRMRDERCQCLHSSADLDPVFANPCYLHLDRPNRPYTLSRIDWTNPRVDPVFRQFVPTRSSMLLDHPKLTLDSLDEAADSPVKGLVHRYPDKALFLRMCSPC